MTSSSCACCSCHEGHYLPNQDIMREQPKSVLSVNLLDDLVQYFNVLSRILPNLTMAADAVGNTIVEVIQARVQATSTTSPSTRSCSKP